MTEFHVGQHVLFNGRRAVVVRLPTADFSLMMVEYAAGTVPFCVTKRDTCVPNDWTWDDFAHDFCRSKKGGRK